MKYGITIRIIVLLIVITAFIILSGFFALDLIRDDSEKLEKNIGSVQNSINAGNWGNASEALDRIKNDWMDIKKTWSALIDHEEIDNIDITIAKLEAMLEAKDSVSALSEAAALRRLVTHIPEREKLSLENLF
ncbi:MAG TPA: DUF4363 family protein [Clostridiales bacterium]|nr:DUF4363 family protein [Clostridiales bacterium]HPP34983.1 DUF4363 family protein [Clostridiales bacterium]